LLKVGVEIDDSGSAYSEKEAMIKKFIAMVDLGDPPTIGLQTFAGTSMYLCA